MTAQGRAKRLESPLAALALGLFAARIVLESRAASNSGAAVLVVATVSVLFSVPLVAWLRQRGLNVLALLALSLYILWPWQDPLLACAIACVVFLASLRNCAGTVSPLVWDALLFVASLALYIRTLAPTILPADGGEFQFVSYVLGIAHPPGYALYTLLSRLCTLVPVGDIAYRVNLFAALTSSLTLVVLCRTVRRATGSGLAGWISAACLGLTPTFWAQSTTANIRSLTALFTALQMGALLAYAETRNAKWLIGFAAAFGLGITHHGSTALHALPYAAFLLCADSGLLRKPRALWKPTVAFLLSLLVVLYLPLRSAMGAPFDPQPIRSLSGFLEHVLALGFRGDMFYFAQPTAFLLRLAVLWNVLTFEFGPLLLALGAWGAARMLARRPSLLLLCGGVWLINALTAIAYRAPQTVEYMMPAHVALGFLGGYGAWALSEAFPIRSLRLLILPAVLAVPLWLGYRYYPSFAQLSRDRSAREYAQSMLDSAPQNARILSNWHYATPLWYLQYVERQRQDVEVVYVYPEGAEAMAQVWLRRVRESASQRPTLVTNHFQEFADAAYQFEPFGGGWLVRTGPVFETPQGTAPMDMVFDECIRFVGLRLESTSVSPAGSIKLRLYWQPSQKLERDYSFFVHLVDGNGVPLGQGDVTHPADRYEVSQVIVDEYRIPLLPTAKPGRYRLIAGVYITLPEGGWRRLALPNGQDAMDLTLIEVQPLRSAPVTRHNMLRSFADRYRLVGVDYDRSVDGQLRVYLHWLCASQATDQDAYIFSKGSVIATARLPRTLQPAYFSTAHDLPADVTDLSLELHAAADGAVSAVLGPAGVPVGRAVQLPRPGPHDRYVCLGGEALLVRAEYPLQVQAGLPARTRMTFVGANPITGDYAVSVSLTGEGWQAQHDGTPAMGAIPTLKWIRAVTVQDRHDVPVPPDASGRGQLHLTVYDAFTMRALPVLDERLARAGQGTQVELGGIMAIRKP